MARSPGNKGLLSALLHLALGMGALVLIVLLFDTAMFLLVFPLAAISMYFVQGALYRKMTAADLRASLAPTLCVLALSHGLTGLLAIEKLMQPTPDSLLRVFGYIFEQAAAVLTLAVGACCIAGHLAAYFAAKRRNQGPNDPPQTGSST